MSLLSDALKTIQQLILIESRIEHLQAANDGLRTDMRDLAHGLDAVSVRLARIEGFIEGAAAASRPKRLPKRVE